MVSNLVLAEDEQETLEFGDQEAYDDWRTGQIVIDETDPITECSDVTLSDSDGNEIETQRICTNSFTVTIKEVECCNYTSPNPILGLLPSFNFFDLCSEKKEVTIKYPIRTTISTVIGVATFFLELPLGSGGVMDATVIRVGEETGIFTKHCVYKPMVQGAVNQYKKGFGGWFKRVVWNDYVIIEVGESLIDFSFVEEDCSLKQTSYRINCKEGLFGTSYDKQPLTITSINNIKGTFCGQAEMPGECDGEGNCIFFTCTAPDRGGRCQSSTDCGEDFLDDSYTCAGEGEHCCVTGVAIIIPECIHEGGRCQSSTDSGEGYHLGDFSCVSDTFTGGANCCIPGGEEPLPG